MDVLKGFFNAASQGTPWTLIMAPEAFCMGQLAMQGTHVLVSGRTCLECSALAMAFPALDNALRRTFTHSICCSHCVTWFITCMAIFILSGSNPEKHWLMVTSQQIEARVDCP